MENKELLKIISKQWCTLEDLTILLDCGRNKALEVKKDLKSKLLKERYYIPANKLPMQAVIDLLKIDIDRLERLQKLSKE